MLQPIHGSQQAKPTAVLAVKRTHFPDTEPLAAPPASCSRVFSKLNIGNRMAPWSRCSFVNRIQLIDWGSSVGRAIGKPQTQNQPWVLQSRHHKTSSTFCGVDKSHLQFTIHCWYCTWELTFWAINASIYLLIQWKYSPQYSRHYAGFSG